MKKGNGYAAYFFINIIEKISKASDIKNYPKQLKVKDIQLAKERNDKRKASFVVPEYGSLDNQFDETFSTLAQRNKVRHSLSKQILKSIFPSKRLSKPSKLIGTIQILRNQDFDLFGPHPHTL